MMIIVYSISVAEIGIYDEIICDDGKKINEKVCKSLKQYDLVDLNRGRH